MLEFMLNIDFIWPWIFLLIPLPIFVAFWNSQSSSRLSILNPANPKTGATKNNTAKNNSPPGVRVSPLLESALADISSNNKKTFKLNVLMLWLAWLLLLLSLARPVILTEKSVLPASGRALSLVVDLSGSMERDDFLLNGVKTDRLSAVKSIATDFLQQRQGDRVSLILYGDNAFVAAPLSFDLHAISNILASSGIGMAGRATAIGDALGLAIQSLRQDNSVEKAIILLSDGTNNAGTAEPESAALLANSLNIRIHTIGLGSANTDEQRGSSFSTAPSADLDEDALMAIAESAGGKFFRATSTTDLAAVYQQIHEIEGGTSEAPPLLLKSDISHWPLSCLLLISLILAAMEFFSGKSKGINHGSYRATEPATVFRNIPR